MRLRRLYLVIMAVLGWAAVITQVFLVAHVVTQAGRPAIDGVVNALSYFTVQTNLIVAVVVTALAVRTAPDSFLTRAGTPTAVAVYIFVVGLVYSLVLRALWEPTGLQRWLDIALHDIMPLLYIGFWLWYIPKRALHWTQPIGWLAYPLLYGTYTLVRGALTRWYPYPFVDASALGYARVGLNLLVMAIGFLVLGLIAVGVGRVRITGRGWRSGA